MKTRILPILLSLSVIIMLVVYPDIYLESSLTGLKIFAVNVLPALLPFFFFSKILSLLGAGNTLGRMLSAPCRRLYNTNGTGGYVFIMSLLSGYPIGAKLISDLVKENQISKHDAKSIMAYTSTSGPMFIIGSVGAIMLEDKKAGIIILVCHYLSALLNGFLYRAKKTTSEQTTVMNYQTTDNILSESVYSSVISVLIAGAYVAIFYMCATMLQNLGIISALSSIITPLFKDSTLASGIIFGTVEMTGGCLILSKSKSLFKLPSICAVISFGGLSVTLQSMTFLESCNIKPTRYLLTKFTQSIIAFFVTFAGVLIIYP